MSIREKKWIQVEIDKDVAEKAELIFEKLGLNQTTAINAFYKQVIADGRLPFHLALSNEQKSDIRLMKAAKHVPLERLETRKEIKVWLENEDYE